MAKMFVINNIKFFSKTNKNTQTQWQTQEM